MNNISDLCLQPGLALYLPLYDLDSSAFKSGDACGHSVTATGAVWKPVGRYFDGLDDCLAISNHDAFKVATGQGFTQLAWIKPVNNTTLCVSSIRKNTGGCFIVMFTDSSDLQVNLRNDDASSTLIQPTGLGISLDSWNFIACARSPAGAVTGFVNSRSASLGNHTGPMTNQDLPFYIGNHYYQNTSHQFFSGQIGMFAHYGRCLTPAEVLEIYLATRRRFQ